MKVSTSLGREAGLTGPLVQSIFNTGAEGASKLSRPECKVRTSPAGSPDRTGMNRSAVRVWTDRSPAWAEGHRESSLSEGWWDMVLVCEKRDGHIGVR